MSLMAGIAGWGIRNIDIGSFSRYLQKSNPPLVELAKDFVEGNVSIKKIFETLQSYQKHHSGLTVAYAATTDFISKSGYQNDRYLKYCDIQIAEAKFLGAEIFRVILGNENGESSEEDIFGFLRKLQTKLGATQIVFELHNGWEMNPARLNYLLSTLKFPIVIDFHNQYLSGWTTEKLTELINPDQLAYFHTRNLSTYVEHENSRLIEEQWLDYAPDVPILWEPKKLSALNLIERWYEHTINY